MAEAQKPKVMKKDKLHEIEIETQKKWADAKVGEGNPDDGRESYLVTFPYPYMNGKLHMGHTFSLTKAEFAARYKKLKGYNVLFPFGFHCTGMPIAACADKLKREVAEYGNPPIFPAPEEDTKEEEHAEKDLSKFAGKKTKATQKKGTAVFQWNIMEQMGVPEHEIPLFQADLQRFGACIDWRRSFITTELNPYYDSFIRWQFNTLKKQDKISFGNRPSVYSPLDKQQCADHDRASGEGVGPQEYTLIKIEVAKPYPKALASLEKQGKKVFLVAATLRPETMFGQTNCWILPEGDYGAYKHTETDVYVMAERAAMNVSYQGERNGFTGEMGKPECLITFKGKELFGSALIAPLCKYKRVYCLPLLTIKMNKGTGVVTSVPADAPDDYMALYDLQTKSKLRDDHGIKEEWCMPFEVVPIIDTPKFADGKPSGEQASAPVICKQMNIASQNDREKLAQAKDEVYMEGFHKGIMNKSCGPYVGQKVRDVKDKVRDELIRNGQAIIYYEPEKEVIARAGCECVVAFTDQWFIKYGEETWKAQIEKHLETYETYKDDTLENFKGVVSWLKEWGCSRQFGLGTKVPFDERFVIESLSDSTIYMAYYTVAHYLQSGPFDGSQRGSLDIDAADLSDGVWDYVFTKGPYPQGCNIPEDKLATMRKEFLYWYPMNMRVSGKDLIGNHLTFSLYNHMAIWGPELMPQSCFTNGHVLMDGQKMSKSLGNFLTIEDGIETYSADAVRIGFANAGDTNEFANFEKDVANAAVLKLYQLEEWSQAVMDSIGDLRTGDFTVMDRIFEATLDVHIQEVDKAMDGMCFRDALKVGFFDMLNSRDDYKNWSITTGMHKSLVLRYLQTQALLLAPIAPHMSEHIWALSGAEGLCCNASWPEVSNTPRKHYYEGVFMNKFLNDVRPAVEKARGGKKPQEVNKVCAYVRSAYHAWQSATLDILKAIYESDPASFPPSDLKTQMKDKLKLEKKEVGMAMGFGDFVVKNMTGPESFETTFPYDQRAVLLEFAPYMTTTMNLGCVEVYDAADDNAPDAKKRKPHAMPGQPAYSLEDGGAPAAGNQASKEEKPAKAEEKPGKGQKQDKGKKDAAPPAAQGKQSKKDKKKGGAAAAEQTPEELAKMAKKKLAAVEKEGGKRGVEIEGACDMGGLAFFCTQLDEPDGNMEYLEKGFAAMNAECDPSEEERKGGAGKVGKVVFSAGGGDTPELLMVCNVPEDKLTNTVSTMEGVPEMIGVSATKWLEHVLAAFVKTHPDAKVDPSSTATYAKAALPGIKELGMFPIKMKDDAMAAAYGYLNNNKCMPPDESDDEVIYHFEADDGY